MGSKLRQWWKRLRREAKAAMPLVRRRSYRILERKFDDLAQVVHCGLPLATEAAIEIRKRPAALSGSVCLFVTHAPRRELKSHVLHHVEHLLRAGVHVVLTVNTDLPLADIDVPADLSSRLAGVFVRSNQGFDFGAWSHALTLCDRSGWERLYLVNDSLVGPVTPQSFDAMMERIGKSDADVVGLTENIEPIPHLQSFFLVFHRRVLASSAFDDVMRHVPNLDDKGQVVDLYELRLTRTLREAGFKARALFGATRGDSIGQWQDLLDTGFPYVKTRALAQHRGNPRLDSIRAAARVDDEI